MVLPSCRVRRRSASEGGCASAGKVGKQLSIATLLQRCNLRIPVQEEEEEEDEERNGVAEDEEMAEASGDAGGAGALSLANGAGPLHDEDDEEPENAVVLHEVCASLRCVASH